jgi:hypothetical protein
MGQISCCKIVLADSRDWRGLAQQSCLNGTAVNRRAVDYISCGFFVNKVFFEKRPAKSFRGLTRGGTGGGACLGLFFSRCCPPPA